MSETQRHPNYPLTTFLTGRSPISDMLVKLLGFELWQLGAWRDFYVSTESAPPVAVLAGVFPEQLEQLRKHPRYLRDAESPTDWMRVRTFVFFHLRGGSAEENKQLDAIDERLARESAAGNVEWMARAIRNYDVATALRIQAGKVEPEPVTWSLGTLG